MRAASTTHGADPDRPSIRDSAALTAREGFERFLRVKEHEGCTPNTLRTYEGIIDRFLRAIGPGRVELVDPFGRVRGRSQFLCAHGFPAGAVVEVA